MMAESYEDKFKTELYKKYEVCRKVLIPKDTYFTMLEEIKTGTKNKHAIKVYFNTIIANLMCLSLINSNTTIFLLLHYFSN